MSNCTGPAYYKIQLAVTQATRDGLARKLSDLKTQVDQLEKIHSGAVGAAWSLGRDAAAVLSAKSGIRRGVWSFNRGVTWLTDQALGWLQVEARPALIWYQRERIPDYYRRWY